MPLQVPTIVQENAETWEVQAPQQTLDSNGLKADKQPSGPIPPLFASTGQGFSNTEEISSSVIRTVDGPNGTSSVTEGTTADPAAMVVTIGGVAMSAIVNPRLPQYPPVFDNAKAAPPIEGSENQGVFPFGHIPIPTIP